MAKLRWKLARKSIIYKQYFWSLSCEWQIVKRHWWWIDNYVTNVILSAFHYSIITKYEHWWICYNGDVLSRLYVTQSNANIKLLYFILSYNEHFNFVLWMNMNNECYQEGLRFSSLLASLFVLSWLRGVKSEKL